MGDLSEHQNYKPDEEDALRTLSQAELNEISKKIDSRELDQLAAVKPGRLVKKTDEHEIIFVPSSDGTSGREYERKNGGKWEEIKHFRDNL